MRETGTKTQLKTTKESVMAGTARKGRHMKENGAFQGKIRK